METSLRDRNRLRTCREIQDAAWALFAEHGYSSVRTEDIARTAGVSSSTYFRYIPNKEELLLGPPQASSGKIVRRFHRRPENEGVGTALSAAIRERTAEENDAEIGAWKAAILTAPEIAARVTLITDTDRVRLMDLASARVGLASFEMRPAIAVQLILSAAEFGYQRWLTGTPELPLSDILDEVLTIALSGDWR